ncbi:hypothetical protein BX600DRAFT_470257 [Xylariales sp. PMI_506]|nr:hypothetical protein BX600DRAFT_470257 [Xylariales sp. PMI_506]
MNIKRSFGKKRVFKCFCKKEAILRWVLWRSSWASSTRGMEENLSRKIKIVFRYHHKTLE